MRCPADHVEAQDCVQEAYVRAWQQRNRVSTSNAPEAGVQIVTWRLSISQFRRARKGAALLRQQRPEESTRAPEPDHVVLVDALRQSQH